MEREVVDNTLEKLRERFLRWDELCSQLRELYYRYLDLAAFRSEKCYFPGRRCKRSWDRKYDLEELTGAWLHITNVAPTCGSLMRVLTNVEYEARLMSLESLRRFGGKERKSRPKNEVAVIRLRGPIRLYVVLWGRRLHVVWGMVDGLNDFAEGDGKVEYIADIIKRYWQGEDVALRIDAFSVDGEYRRYWPEISLSKDVSKLLGGRDKAPVALFRNLGWLLSDDSRDLRGVQHMAGNPGQVALRLFDWIALTKYAIDVLKIAPDKPLMFKLSIHYVSSTRDGPNPALVATAVGSTTKVLQSVYDWFGVRSSNVEGVLARGYALLKALREEAFGREGKFYVVNDVGAWVAYSNMLGTVIIGDGSISPYDIVITAKISPELTLDGTTSLAKELAKAVGGNVSGGNVHLPKWQMRLLLPISPTPAFEKTKKLYEALVNYPVAALIKMGNDVYMLTHEGRGRFVIHGKRAIDLSKALSALGLEINIRMRSCCSALYLRNTHLSKLIRRGLSVRLLNDVEKAMFKDLPQVPAIDLELLERALKEIAKMAKIELRENKGRIYVRIIPYDKSYLGQIAELLRAAGVRFTVPQKRREITIYEQKSVKAIQMLINTITYFSTPIFGG